MKLVVLTFAGRECNMRILFPLIIKYKQYIDEYRLYVATEIPSDINYIEKFANDHDFVKVVYSKIDGNITFIKEVVWNLAYNSCQEDDTVYLKLDDDIVYFDETLFTDFIQYRIQNRSAPILYPVIINNHFMSWFLQEKDIIQPSIKSHIGNTWPTTYQRIRQHILNNQKVKMRIGDFIQDHEILCPIGWGNLHYCVELHNQFINDIQNNNIGKYYFENVVLHDCQSVSINVCSWIGEDLKKYVETYGEIYSDEAWLSVYLPTWSGNKNEIYGRSVVSHYAYYKQRELGLDHTDILERYYLLL